MIAEALIVIVAVLICGAAWAYAIDAIVNALFVDDGKSEKKGKDDERP